MKQVAVLPRVVAQRRDRSVMLGWAIVTVAALLPRLFQLGSFVTMDEVSFWFARSEIFLGALRSGNFAATAISDHPGVTTMWLGSLSLVLREQIGNWRVPMTPELVVALFDLPVALVNGIAVGIGYLLLRPLIPQTIALLGALLWALDPFVVAYSRVLHTDALAGTFLTLSLLAACRYWFHTPKPTMLIVSGVCAALGMLSKSPALILIPVFGAIGMYAHWRQTGTRPPRLIPSLLGWGGVTLLAAIVFWPALWAAPLQAIDSIRIGYTAEGTQPHMMGNYFLGEAVEVPNALFYPVAVALRLTPLTFIGVLVLPWAWRELAMPAEARRSLFTLAWFVVLFVVAMSLFAKKFNRYIVPAFPALDILAAFGLFWLCAYALPRAMQALLRVRSGPRAQAVLLGIVVLGAAANIAWWQPYYISAYNQLLGGARAGAWAFKTGWSEGMEQVAAWLNQQPDITGVLTVTTLTPGLQTYLRPGAQSVTPPIGPLPEQSGYVVVYISNQQMGPLPPPFDAFYNKREPIKTVRIHGVDYAWIYEVPPQAERTVDATFGSTIRVVGVSSPASPQPGDILRWTVLFPPQAQPPAGTMLFAHLLGPDNARYGQIDLPFPPEQWRAGRHNLQEIPLALPADAPPGTYQLVIGMYSAADGARLPLVSPTTADPALDGPSALLLDTVTIR